MHANYLVTIQNQGDIHNCRVMMTDEQLYKLLKKRNTLQVVRLPDGAIMYLRLEEYTKPPVLTAMDAAEEVFESVELIEDDEINEAFDKHPERSI